MSFADYREALVQMPVGRRVLLAMAVFVETVRERRPRGFLQTAATIAAGLVILFRAIFAPRRL